MNENKNNVETKEETKKENIFKRTGKKIGGFFKKRWPFLLGGTVLAGGALAYILLKDDEDKEDYSLLDSDKESDGPAE